MQFETSYVFSKKLTAEPFTSIILAIEWPWIQRGDEMLGQNSKIIHKRVTAARMNFKKEKKAKWRMKHKQGVWVLARKGERLPQRLSIVVLLCLRALRGLSYFYHRGKCRGASNKGHAPQNDAGPVAAAANTRARQQKDDAASVHLFVPGPGPNACALSFILPVFSFLEFIFAAVTLLWIIFEFCPSISSSRCIWGHSIAKIIDVKGSAVNFLLKT